MVTKKQISALKYLIYKSNDGNELTKRILSFLIDQSEGLTKSVCLTLLADREGYSANEIDMASHEFSRMTSCNGSTHLNELLALMNGRMLFSVHYGDYDRGRGDEPLDTSGQFSELPLSVKMRSEHRRKGCPVRYTFWLAKSQYSVTSNLVTVTRVTLEKINLKKPGLYPTLEK